MTEGFSLERSVAIVVSFYRVTHYSAKRGLAMACRLSVCDVGGS